MLCHAVLNCVDSWQTVRIHAIYFKILVSYHTHVCAGRTQYSCSWCRSTPDDVCAQRQWQTQIRSDSVVQVHYSSWSSIEYAGLCLEKSTAVRIDVGSGRASRRIDFGDRQVAIQQCEVGGFGYLACVCIAKRAFPNFRSGNLAKEESRTGFTDGSSSDASSERRPTWKLE